ncbi:MAG TPA: patatin-like phospholipase family protein [Humisphaera sp.]|nr:patatin-like phospholipase family protein [Humisphaera sp.]
MTVPSIPHESVSRPYRILSLDGGGIRGVLTTRILERIETACPGFVSKIDLIAGTSSGAMIAVGVAKGLPLSQVVSNFVRSGPIIFRRTFMRTVLGLMGVFSAKYGAGPRRETLAEAFGDITLGELQKRVVLSTFQLDSKNKFAPSDTVPRMWKAKFFHNYPGRDSDAAANAVDVVMRSSAAPTYFPIYQGFIDGGVVANNPAMCGVAQAVHPNGGGQSLGSLVLLSLGTGLTPATISSLYGNFGFARWGLRLFDLIAAGGVGLPDYQCSQILCDRYCRVDPVYTQHVAIDDPNGIDALLKMANDADLAPCIAWIKSKWL